MWAGAPAEAGARGVAAIELVVVIAATLLMLALAVSAYRTYTARQEVTRSLAAVASIQELVTDAFKRTGVPPVSERELPGVPTAKQAHRIIEAVAIKHGAIEMVFGKDADTSLRGRSVHVMPFETMDGEVVWICGFVRPASVSTLSDSPAATDLKRRPRTTVEPHYLPAECR